MPVSSAATQGSGLVLSSSGFEADSTMPTRFTADGDDVSPPLVWAGIPDGTRSLALVCVDLDAPGGEFTHWLLWDIPLDPGHLHEGSPQGTAGRNDFGNVGWGGPRPPVGHGPHHYVFRLYAVDVASLGLSEGASRADLEAKLKEHTLSMSELSGSYGR